MAKEWGRIKIEPFVGPQEPLLAAVKRWKLIWFAHATRHDNLSKTILGGWATPWSAEKILDGQHQRVDVPVSARAAHKGFYIKKKRLGDELC